MLDKYDYKPIYLQLSELLRESIFNGDFDSNGQIPPEETLCSKYEVSRNTVRSALKKLESEGQIHRVKGRGTFVSPRIEKDLEVIVVFRKYATKYQAGQSLLSGIISKSQELNAQIRLVSPEQLSESIDTLKLQSQKVSGAIFLRSYNISKKTLSQLQKKRVPFLIEGRSTPCNCNCLDIDNVDAIGKSIEHLFEFGHRKIAYISVDAPNKLHFKERLDAFRKYVKNKIGGIDENLIASVPEGANEEIHEKSSLLSKRGATAILCANDDVAVEACNQLKKMGISIPGQISVMGFDDAPFSQFTTPTLTTIKQDYFELGCIACEHLLKMMTKHNNKLFRTKVKLPVIARESTGITRIID